MINSLLMVPWWQDSLFCLNIEHRARGKTGEKGTQTLASVAGDLCQARYLFCFFFSLSLELLHFLGSFPFIPKVLSFCSVSWLLWRRYPAGGWVRILLRVLFIKRKDWVNFIPGVHSPLEDERFIAIFSRGLINKVSHFSKFCTPLFHGHTRNCFKTWWFSGSMLGKAQGISNHIWRSAS